MSTTRTVSGYSEGEDVFSFSHADNEVVLANVADLNATSDKQAVADLVYSWRPDAIFTNGDNCDSSVQNYDADIGSYYGDYMDRGLVWPCPGNHDWDDGTLAAYLDYFSAVVSERYYYKKTFGPVSLYMLDSNSGTPDGYISTSPQAEWLTLALANSCSPWNIVVFHHPPYTSGATHADSEWMRWGFGALGADIVLNGHGHQYERLYNDTHYIVNGLGGSAIHSFEDPVSAYSVFRYNDLHGAGKLIATPNKLRWEFRNRSNALVDSLVLEK